VVRCPQCGYTFAAANDAPEPLVAVTPTASPALKMGLLAFGLVGTFGLLVAGTVAVVVLSNNEPSRAAADAERRIADERAAWQKRLVDLREDEVRDRRRLEQKVQDLEAQAKARDERPVAPAAAPAPPPVIPAPRAPDPKAAADEAERKTRADYEARMDAGRAAMVDQRYADALREYRAALRLLPGDAAAERGVRDAEDRLARGQERGNQRVALAGVLDQARTALNAKRYDDAISAANQALGLAPTNAEAKQIVSDATRAKRTAKADFAQLIEQGDALRASGRYADASVVYARALQISPDDVAAQTGKQLADQAVQSVVNTQVGLTAYYNSMAIGMAAMQNGQFVTAARAFTDALNLVPGDMAAARGVLDAREALKGTVRGQAAFFRHLQAGYAALQSKRPADAISEFQAALRIAPDSIIAAAALRQAKAMNK
jgi:tetratricopeptide (TPR) repeat protein